MGNISAIQFADRDRKPAHVPTCPTLHSVSTMPSSASRHLLFVLLRIKQHSRFTSGCGVMYLAEVSQLRAKHEADLADLRQALEAARAEAAQEQLDLDNMYRPISEFGKLSDSELHDACYDEALADGFICQGADRSKSLTASVLDRYSAMVTYEKVGPLLPKPSQSGSSAQGGQGDFCAAKRIKIVLGACSS